jgi:hypothetical protein
VDPLALQADAEETAISRDRRRSLSLAAHERLKQTLLSDSYLFARVICKHKDLIPSIHMPVSYLACGLVDRLIETLDMPALDSYVTRKIRHELWRRGIDWKTREGRLAVDTLINGSLIRPAIINIRMFRRLFKSSVITHAGTLFIATVDPNETIKITHAVDPKAWEFCEQIGQTILSGTYHDFFPDRIPAGDLSKAITQKRITLAGRTISHPQTTIQAGGYGTKEEAAHYSTFVTDDLVTDLNSSPDMLRGVLQYMKRMTGYYMPTRRIRRIEVGTKHDEDDDDAFLTSGHLADSVFTLRVPIEEYDHRLVNIMERGKPTCPELFSTERIVVEQQHVLSGEDDEDGYRTWWNQYQLSATGGTLRLFPPEIVDDPDRWWMGPYEHPVLNWRNRGHFLVARFKRLRDGRPVAKAGQKIWSEEGELLDDWRQNAEILSFDPWREFDRAILVDPAWADTEHSDNWAVTCVGQDVEDCRYQLQSLSAKDGMEGWISALAWLDEKWSPRIIGFDGAALQDQFVQNVMRTDRRLRRLASRMLKVQVSHQSKAIRLQEGVAEPLNCYKFFLAPPHRGTQGADEFGGNITRSELKLIKSTTRHAVRTDQDGIADTLAMSPTVLRAARRKLAPKLTISRRVDPVLGVAIEPAPRTVWR